MGRAHEEAAAASPAGRYNDLLAEAHLLQADTTARRADMVAATMHPRHHNNLDSLPATETRLRPTTTVLRRDAGCVCGLPR